MSGYDRKYATSLRSGVSGLSSRSSRSSTFSSGSSKSLAYLDPSCHKLQVTRDTRKGENVARSLMEHALRGPFASSSYTKSSGTHHKKDGGHDHHYHHGSSSSSTYSKSNRASYGSDAGRSTRSSGGSSSMSATDVIWGIDSGHGSRGRRSRQNAVLIDD
jgi:hypothetical protein